MKNLIFVSALFVFITLNAFSQQDFNLLKRGQFLRKGKITLKDGKTQKFRNLKYMNDYVNFKNFDGKMVDQKISDVEKITKKTNLGWVGFFTGGLSGLLSASQFINQTKQDGTANFVKIDSTPIIVGFTAGGAILGGLLGLCFSNEKTVYNNSKGMSFYPSVQYLNSGKYYASLTLRLNLN
jgi:hypothetical protein